MVVRDNVIADVISKDLIAMNVMLNFLISPIVLNVVITIMEQLMISVMRMAYVPVNMVLVVTSVMNALMDYMVSPIAKIAHHFAPFVNVRTLDTQQ